MTLLTREMILAARDLGFEVVEVPEWGGAVSVSVMDGATREALNESLQGGAKASKFHAHMLAATLVDADGVHMFSLEDIEMLRRKNPEVMQRLSDAAMRINKIATGAVEAEVKNSEAAPN